MDQYHDCWCPNFFDQQIIIILARQAKFPCFVTVKFNRRIDLDYKYILCEKYLFLYLLYQYVDDHIIKQMYRDYIAVKTIDRTTVIWSGTDELNQSNFAH